MVALTSLTALAATNYDLLGRRGSQMNSPMVYRDIDYSKANEGIQNNNFGPVERNALARQGLNNKVAIEGRAQYRNSLRFVLKTYTSSGKEEFYFGDPSKYLEKANTVFTKVNKTTSRPSNLVTAPGTTTPGYSVKYESNYFSENYRYDVPYGDAGTITLRSQQYLWSKSEDTRVVNPKKISKVGIYIANNAKPTKPSKKEDIRFVNLDNSCSQTTAYHGNEALSTKAALTLNQSTVDSVAIYGHDIRCGNVSSPENKSPQIYMGLHISGGELNQWNNGHTKTYDDEAKNLDDYIYNNHTIEIAAAGNFGKRQNHFHMAAEAHAANVITVGAVDPTTNKYVVSSSWKNDNTSMKKPEIANYTNFYFAQGTSDKMNKIVYNKGNDYLYEPYFAETEGAASYTAAMVANFLMEHPFYRWHPEIVKAILLTSSTIKIKNSSFDQDSGPTHILSAKGIAFDESDNGNQNILHDSRYWIGKFDKFQTHTSPKGKKEIHFTVGDLSKKCSYRAAIAWLSKGTDIKSLGKVPQDIDLFVYEAPKDINPQPRAVTDGSGLSYFEYTTKTDITKLTPLDSSTTARNPYEVVKFTTSSPTVTFNIRLHSDNSSDNGNVVLGFDLAEDCRNGK